MANKPDEDVLTVIDVNKLQWEHGEHYRGLIDAPAYIELKEKLLRTNPGLVKAVEDLRAQLQIVDVMVSSLESAE